jgi:hypothetical protein
MSRERKSSRGTKPNSEAISEKKRKRKQPLVELENEIVNEIIDSAEPEMIIDPVRRLIGKELLDTERTYVTQLELLINVCLVHTFSLCCSRIGI